jgi:hypothetical protein
MKMKFIVLAFFATFQVITSSAALAWSPLDSFESAVGSMPQCYLVVAGSDDDQDGNQQKDGDEEEDEEEEEPDCD